MSLLFAAKKKYNRLSDQYGSLKSIINVLVKKGLYYCVAFFRTRERRIKKSLKSCWCDEKNLQSSILTLVLSSDVPFSASSFLLLWLVLWGGDPISSLHSLSSLQSNLDTVRYYPNISNFPLKYFRFSLFKVLLPKENRMKSVRIQVKYKSAI